MTNEARNYALSVASRVIAAAIGGYVLANTFAIALSRVLPMQLGDAVMAMILLSFAIYVTAIIWAFAARTPLRAWIGLLCPIALTASILLVTR